MSVPTSYVRIILFKSANPKYFDGVKISVYVWAISLKKMDVDIRIINSAKKCNNRSE